MFYIQDLFAQGLRVTENKEQANEAYGAFETLEDANRKINQIFRWRKEEKAQIERIKRLKGLARLNAFDESEKDLISRIVRVEDLIQVYIKESPNGKETGLKLQDRLQLERLKGEREGLMMGLGVVLHLQDDNQD